MNRRLLIVSVDLRWVRRQLLTERQEERGKLEQMCLQLARMREELYQ